MVLIRKLCQTCNMIFSISTPVIMIFTDIASKNVAIYSFSCKQVASCLTASFRPAVASGASSVEPSMGAASILGSRGGGDTRLLCNVLPLDPIKSISLDARNQFDFEPGVCCSTRTVQDRPLGPQLRRTIKSPGRRNALWLRGSAALTQMLLPM